MEPPARCHPHSSQFRFCNTGRLVCKKAYCRTYPAGGELAIFLACSVTLTKRSAVYLDIASLKTKPAFEVNVSHNGALSYRDNILLPTVALTGTLSMLNILLQGDICMTGTQKCSRGKCAALNSATGFFNTCYCWTSTAILAHAGEQKNLARCTSTRGASLYHGTSTDRPGKSFLFCQLRTRSPPVPGIRPFLTLVFSTKTRLERNLQLPPRATKQLDLKVPIVA